MTVRSAMAAFLSPVSETANAGSVALGRMMSVGPSLSLKPLTDSEGLMSGWPREDHTENCPCPARCDELQTCVGRCHPDSIFQRGVRDAENDKRIAEQRAIAARED